MKTTGIDAEDWSLIVERIHDGLCVLFLGAGVNISSGEYKGLPSGSDVALRILELWMDIQGTNLKDITKVVTHEKIMQSESFNDLTRVALQNLARVSLHVEFRNDFARLIKYLKKIIADEECTPSPLLDTLAKLPLPKKSTNPPFQLIITTNYDCLVERALKNNNKEFEVVVQPIEGFNPDAKKRLDEKLANYNDIVVYKIHGTFEDESSIIITEEDYIKFLVNSIGKEDGGIPNLIKAKLVDSTLLFLGYSLEDWDFRTIFKGLIETLPPRKKRKSFAIQRYPTGFWVDFWNNKGVQICDIDIYEFAEDLELCLGIKKNDFLVALCEEFKRSKFDLIAARRASRKSWKNFTFNIVEESLSNHKMYNEIEIQNFKSEIWNNFTQKYKIFHDSSE